MKSEERLGNPPRLEDTTEKWQLKEHMTLEWIMNQNKAMYFTTNEYSEATDSLTHGLDNIILSIFSSKF